MNNGTHQQEDRQRGAQNPYLEVYAQDGLSGSELTGLSDIIKLILAQESQDDVFATLRALSELVQHHAGVKREAEQIKRIVELENNGRIGPAILDVSELLRKLEARDTGLCRKVKLAEMTD